MAGSKETPTKVKIISDALILLGEQPLTSIDDARHGARVGVNLFERLYENELCSNRWRFAIDKQALSQLAAAPLNEWQYAYQLPSGLLLPIRVYPDANYEIYTDKLFSNHSAVELDFVFKPDLGGLPSYFYELMVCRLAWRMARAVTEAGSTVEEMYRAYVQQRDVALYADAQGRPNQPFSDSPFTDIR